VSSLEPRGGRRLSRAQKQSRAFQSVLAAGAFSVLAVVTFVLAVAGAIGFFWFVASVIAAAVAVWRFRRTVD